MPAGKGTYGRKLGRPKSLNLKKKKGLRSRVKPRPKVKTDADVRKGWVKTYEDRFKPKTVKSKYKVGK